VKYRKRGKELKLGKEALRCEEGCVILKRVWKEKQVETSKLKIKVKVKVKITIEQATKVREGVAIMVVLFL